MKYQVWATTNHGEGKVTSLGVFEDPTEIEINIGTFSKDVVITIEEYIDDDQRSTIKN